MDELTFFEPEALEASLAAASNHLNMRRDTPALAGAMPQSDADAINDFMVALYKSAPADLVSLTESVVEPVSLHGYGMRLRTVVRNGRPHQMTFFRVKPAWPTIAISLVGLSIALASFPPGGLAAALLVAKTTYENLVSLDSPHDSAAMRSYEALIRWRSERSDGSPTVAEMIPLMEPDAPSEAQITKALQRLADLQLVKVSTWGGLGGDLDDRGNQWTTQL
jgi:hypothetical protein